MPLKIMTWNIEQFGMARSSVDTRVEIVAGVIAQEKPDIFVLIELKTTKPADAVTIINGRLIPKITALTGVNYQFTLTYSNSLELYVFIYKQGITPLTLTNGQPQKYNDFTNLQFVSTNQSTQVVAQNRLRYFFPLLDSCYRSPGIGFFKFSNQYLAIITWHNMANRVQAGGDIEKLLEYFDWLDQKTITITADNQTVNINNIIITGDFNIDYTNDQYGYYTNLVNKYPPCITTKTHLKEYNPGQKVSNYTDILSYAYDNFFISLNGMTKQNAKVVSHPKFVREEKYRRGRLYGYVFQHIALQYLSFGYEDCIAYVKELLGKYLDDNLGARRYDTVRNNIKLIVNTNKIRLSKNPFYQDTHLNLQTAFAQLGGNWQEKYNAFCLEAAKYGHDQEKVLYRFNGYMMASSYADLSSFNDVILLSRWVSDHLPIVLELN